MALVASGIGAAGAIAGQVVAAVFTGRRESRRLAWEKERAAEERQNERRKQFVETKRATYARFVQLMAIRHDLLIEMWADTHRRAEHFKKFTESEESWWSEITEVLAEISLLNPSLEQLCRKVYGKIGEWAYDVTEEGGIEDTQNFVDAFEEPFRAAQEAMRQDLGVVTVADRVQQLEQ